MLRLCVPKLWFRVWLKNAGLPVTLEEVFTGHVWALPRRTG